MSSNELDMFVTKHGRFAKLDHLNWHAWEDNMKSHMRVSGAYDIVFNDAERPDEPRANVAGHVYNRQMGLCDKHDKARLEAQSALWLGVFDEAHQYVSSEDEPSEMWTALSAAFNPTNSAVGRQTIWKKFTASRPVPGEQIGVWFAKLLGWRQQLAGSPEAIPDMSVRMHIFENLPASFRNAIETEQMRPNDMIMQTMERLKAFELANTLYVNPAGEALNAQGQPSGRGRATATPRGRGRGQGRGAGTTPMRGDRGTRGRSQTANGYPHARPDHNKYCNKHGKSGHDTSECLLPNTQPAIAKRRSSFCLHCGDEGHFADKCPVKAKLNKKLKQTGSAYSTTTTFAGSADDGDPGH